MKCAYKPNPVHCARGACGDHSSRPCVAAWLERPTRKHVAEIALDDRERTARMSTFPYLALHRKEFTWPRTVTSRAGELLPHPFTHHPGVLSHAI